MSRRSYAAVSLGLFSIAIPSRAANKPHAGMDAQTVLVWSNNDLEKLHDLGMISIVGRVNDETEDLPSVPQPQVDTQDPGWYARQASQLRDELERRQAQLHAYQQALEDAQSLRNTTSGINFVEDSIGITPEAAIEILRQRMNETQTELDALDDLARRNDMPPGAVRGQ